MATSPITFSGLNGFDFSSIINAEIQSASQPMQAMQRNQTGLQNKNSVLSNIGDQVSQLEDTVTTLASQTAFTNVTATSADSTIATVSAGSGGTAGSYDLNVTKLAKSQLTSSTNGYTNTTDIVADGGSISFTIGSQTTTPITISGQTSLSDLANQINSQNSGVFAAVVNDGTNNKLAIMSRQTGKANGFTINNHLTNGSGTLLAFAPGQGTTSGNAQDAADASFTVNGLTIASGSNTVTNAIPGLTVSLSKAGETLVSVTPDYTTVQNTIATLVSQYNNLQQYVKSQAATVGSDPIARQVMQDIRSQLMASSGSGQYKYLAQIGVQFNSDGTLTFNQGSLQSALTSAPSDVQTLFQGSGGNGLFNTFLSALQADDSTAGLISTATSSNNTEIQTLTSDIAAQQQMINLRQTQLTKMYAAADQAMTALRASGQSLSQFGTQSLF
jgi:flagellar hook-associated protein 2